jgi:hypothetical protein
VYKLVTSISADLRDDFYQEGLRAGLEAYRKYPHKPDEERMKIAAVAARNAIRNELRKLKRRPKTRNLPDGIQSPGPNLATEEVEALRALATAEEEAVIEGMLVCILVEGLYPRGIKSRTAEMLGTSPSTITRRVQSLAKKGRQAGIRP